MSDRSSTPSQGESEEEQLRLPLELLLPIFRLASLSCDSPSERSLLHSRLRLVNRLLSRLYARRSFRALRLGGGEALPELIGRLKKERETAGMLEGVELRNMVPWESREGLRKEWKKLSKLCEGLQYLQVGDREVWPKASAGVDGFVLGGMQGLSALRLISLEISHAVPPYTLTSWSPSIVPIIPPNLRHLTLSSVTLRKSVLRIDWYDTVWPPLAQCTLTTLFLCDLQLANAPGIEDGDLPALLRKLLEASAQTLQALHYSCRLPADQPLSDLPSLLDNLAFPSLRVLSVSFARFPPSLFSAGATPRLEHLALTLCDLVGGARLFVPRCHFSLAAFEALEAALSPSASSMPMVLKVLEVYKRTKVGFMEQETSLYRRVKEKRSEVLEMAREKGIEVSEPSWEDADVESAFREKVREVLGEKV
ncbi:hypothetical protein JCM10213_006282 [Rhodosporidiobolus nylandii]